MRTAIIGKNLVLPIGSERVGEDEDKQQDESEKLVLTRKIVN